jgi:hypothetical protein
VLSSRTTSRIDMQGEVVGNGPSASTERGIHITATKSAQDEGRRAQRIRRTPSR